MARKYFFIENQVSGVPGAAPVGFAVLTLEDDEEIDRLVFPLFPDARAHALALSEAQDKELEDEADERELERDARWAA